MSLLKSIIKKFLKIFNLKIMKIDYGFNNFPIVEATEEQKQLMHLSGKYSMTSLIRRWSLIQSIKYINDKKIDGDFVECGVWKGGNLLIFEKLNLKFNLRKKIYAYDTFAGMSEPTEYDKDLAQKNAKVEWNKNAQNKEINYSFNCYAGLNEVKNNLKENLVKIDNINLIEGKVESTLVNKVNLPNKISILRLDTDWYESTKIELDILYPLLEVGGILIIDDYGYWQGSRKAVDEYFKDKNVWLQYVDHSCRMIVKN